MRTHWSREGEGNGGYHLPHGYCPRQASACPRPHARIGVALRHTSANRGLGRHVTSDLAQDICVAGCLVYRRLKPASCSSPCYLFVKPRLLAACVAPHGYLSGPAISPPVCIHRQLRPNDMPASCKAGRTTDSRPSSIPLTRLAAHRHHRLLSSLRDKRRPGPGAGPEAGPRRRPYSAVRPPSPHGGAPRSGL